MIEGQPGAQRAQRAAHRAECGAPSEVAAADAVRHQLAHPGRPGVVASYRKEGAGPRDGEQQGALRIDGQADPRQRDEHQRKLARCPDGQKRGAPAAMHAGEPGRRDLQYLRGERQRAEHPDQDGGKPQVQGPCREGSTAGAGADELGNHSLGN